MQLPLRDRFGFPVSDFRLALPHFAFSFAVALLASAPAAHADVNVMLTPVRDYQLPGSFELTNGRVLEGAGGDTLIVNTIGASPEEAACGIVVATDADARLIEYRYASEPTQCIGALPHPDGGLFLRGSNPTAVAGEVTGFTSFIGPDDMEVWSIDDELLTTAQPEPTGTGEFQGAYETPHGAMAYSPQLDKLLGFTISKLTIGIDEKFLSQAHVVNVEMGRLTVSGQTFGQSGVGIVGGAEVRRGDGQFLIYYFSSGDQGAFFYEYNGRQDVSFFKPRGEDWDDRFVIRMLYRNDLLHLLWTPSDGTDTQTRVTATTDAGAELYSATFEPEYRFADGTVVELGRPITMWVTADYTAILTTDVSMTELFLRVLDNDGESLGLARLSDISEFAPVAIVTGENDTLKLLSYDQSSRHVYENTMEFTDVDDFDPDMGIPDGGFPEDIGLPADIGVADVLEAAGCCTTIKPHRLHAAALGLALLGAVAMRRRRRD